MLLFSTMKKSVNIFQSTGASRHCFRIETDTNKRHISSIGFEREREKERNNKHDPIKYASAIYQNIPVFGAVDILCLLCFGVLWELVSRWLPQKHRSLLLCFAIGLCEFSDPRHQAQLLRCRRNERLGIGSRRSFFDRCRFPPSPGHEIHFRKDPPGPRWSEKEVGQHQGNQEGSGLLEIDRRLQKPVPGSAWFRRPGQIQGGLPVRVPGHLLQNLRAMHLQHRPQVII